MNSFDTSHSQTPNYPAFIEKVKKQAKRLLKLAKEHNGQVDINNLSQAQELLAQINGYPNWHALEVNIKNALQRQESFIGFTPIVKPDEEYIHIPEVAKDFHAMEHGDFIVSFLQLADVPWDDKEQFNQWMQQLQESIAMRWNMGFHQMELILYYDKGAVGTAQTYNLLPWAEHFSMKKEEFEELFQVNIMPQHNTHKKLHVTMAIKTQRELVTEHLPFCRLLEPFNFKVKSKISEMEYNLFKGLTEFEHAPQAKVCMMSGDFSLEKMLHHTDGKEIKTNHNNWICGLQMMESLEDNVAFTVQFTVQEPTRLKIYTIIDRTESIRKHATYIRGIYRSLTTRMYDDVNYDKNPIVAIEHEENHLSSSMGLPFMNNTDEHVDLVDFNVSDGSNINLIYAKPGMGKSVLVNSILLWSCLSSKSLPYTGIVDIGEGARGAIDLLEQLVGTQDKGSILYLKPNKKDNYCINIFDTPLGVRMPGKLHQKFLESFLHIVMETTKIPASHALIRHFLEKTYLHCSHRHTAKRYHAGENRQIDALLQANSIATDESTVWWDIVDGLVELGHLQAAKSAQRHAAPVMADLLVTLGNEHDDFTAIYQKVQTSTGEGIFPYLRRQLIDATIQFPFIKEPTNVDVDHYKLVAVNLEHLMGKTQADKHDTLVYMLYGHLVNKYNYCDMEEITHCVSNENISKKARTEYLKYHHTRLNDLGKTAPVMVFDELHRCSQLNTEYLAYLEHLSHKANCMTVIASQNSNVVDTEVVLRSRRVFVGYESNKKSSSNLEHVLGQHSSSRYRNYPMNSFMTSFKTPQGREVKNLSLKLNAFVLMALSSTAEDTALKQELASSMGYFAALKLLSKKFPQGCKKEVSHITEQLMTMHHNMDDEQQAIEILARQLLLDRRHLESASPN